MTDATTAPAETSRELFIPHNRLKKSPNNVRKTPHAKADIEALAASIQAEGLLQNIVVEPEIDANGNPTGDYLVPVGEGRRLAYRLLAKKKLIAKDAPVRCMLASAQNIRAISLAENIIRTAMHPADQFDAFAKLHNEDGMSADAIALRFGVSTALVTQRLKLGAVSPKLMKRYRAGEMNLDQLSAFTITDDHERQERVWKDLSSFGRSRSAILSALCEGQVASGDRRARFVGPEAYQAAGGTIIRDLFDVEDGGFYADADLLNRLVGEKLQAEADAIAAEGWKWIEAVPEFDYQATGRMRRIYPEGPALTDEQQEQLAALEDEYNLLANASDGEIGEDIASEFERLEAAIAALNGDETYDPADVAKAGAYLCLGHDGAVRIERGFVRPEDEEAASAEGRDETGDGGEKPKGPAPLSEKLVAELTAYRTAALRNELAQRPDIALIAITHALAAEIFGIGRDPSCLDTEIRSTFLQSFAPGIAASRAETETSQRHEGWIARLPETSEALWGFITALAEDERTKLLAHCIALTVNVVRAPGRPASAERFAHADQLAAAVSLDMTAYWQPTAETYLGRVSKNRILEAVAEGVSADAADNISGMKKPAMAATAERRLAGTGWLPEVLRTPQAEPGQPTALVVAAE